MAAGGTIIASAYQLLRRGCTYDQFVTAVNTCVLPAGVKLMQIAEGSVILKVQAENISALNTLWCLYTDGTLKESLQALFFIDELRELTGEEQVEVIVTIDEEEYDKAREELIREAQGVFFFSFPVNINARMIPNFIFKTGKVLEEENHFNFCCELG